MNLRNRVKAQGNGVTALLYLASQFQFIAHLLSAQRRRERERRRHKTFGHPVKLDVRARGCGQKKGLRPWPSLTLLSLKKLATDR